MKRFFWANLLLITLGTAPALAGVGTGYTLFGQAAYVSPGKASNRAVQLTSNGDANPPIYSGIDFAVPANLTIDNVTALSTDYNFTASSCGVGSPRFGISLSGYSGTIFVYIGPYPNYSGCATNTWTGSGNLVNPTSHVDTSQLPGGNFYDTWQAAQMRYSGQIVTDMFLVSDFGPTGSQTVLIDNTDVNGTLYDYEFSSAEDCKRGGWQNFVYPPGPFKNQGQCVSYFQQQQH